MKVSSLVLDTGDTTWIILAGSLVFLMIPALALFEAGLLRKKNAVSVFMQIFFGLGFLSLMWFIFGFSMAFGPDQSGLIGGSDFAFLKGVPWDDPLEEFAPTIPGMTFVQFQMVVAVVTPLLLTGVIAERMKFSSFIIFIAAWSIFIYYPLVHWVWGGGWLAQLGVADFAGGIVIHASAGMSALAAAIVLGRRKDFGPAIMVPHNIPLAVFGASLLWLGWFGFNAGSALAAGGIAANTIMVTHLSSSAAALVWIGLSWKRTGKPSVVSGINGALAGLVGITPAAGFVSVEHAVLIGLGIGFASYAGLVIFKERLRIDDALDVSAVHGVAGIVGSLSVGIFASAVINPDGPVGALFGNVAQFGSQLLGVGVAIALGFGGTFIIMKIIKAVTGVRVSEKVEDAGLDIGEHAEEAYADEEEYKLGDKEYKLGKDKSKKFKN
ncbi:MAG TPA: ammonium transporter [Nitrosopumilaceae archaeon]|nr:ammonium transporter [Nitrosopumilaceae archaeon]